MKSLLAWPLLAAAVGLQACGGAAADSLSQTDAPRPGTNPVPSRQIVAVIDLSSSRKRTEVEDSRRFLETLVEHISFGDRIVLVQAHSEGQDDRAFMWYDTMPSLRSKPANPYDEDLLKKARDGAKAVVPLVFDSTTTAWIRNTDILASLHTVAERRSESGNRRMIVVLLSDMLHSTPGIDMEKSVPTTATADALAKKGLIPRLDGACVIVVGALTSTDEGIKLREFWQSYFAAAGATLAVEDYKYKATDPGSFGCLRAA